MLKSTRQVLLFIFSPIAAAIFSASQLDRRGTGIGFILFCGFFGFSYVIENQSIDVNVLIERYNDFYSNYTWADFTNLLLDYVQLKEPDLLEPSLRFLVSRLFEDHRYFLAFLGIFFGYFYALTIREHLQWTQRKLGWANILFFLGFVLVINVNSGVNQFRFWAASIIMILGVLKYLRTGQLKFMFLATSSVLVHIGLMAMIMPIWLWVFSNKRAGAFLVIFGLSFIFNGLNLTALTGYIEFFGQAASNKYSIYTSEYSLNRADQLQERNWYAVYWRVLVIYSGSVVLVWAYFRKLNSMSPTLKRYFTLVLLAISLTNFYSSFPMNFRYQTIAAYMVMSWLFLFVGEFNWRKVVWPVSLTYFPVMLLIAMNLRSLLSGSNIYLFVSNPLLQSFITSDQSLLDLL